jgi:hypothetical protein
MDSKKHKILLRWFVLIVIMLHVIYVNVYDLIVRENTIPQITQKYKSLFVPAGYTFSIWIPIYIALIIYAVYQLLLPQRRKYIYNEIALPLMIAMTLGIWWGITFHLELIGMSMIAIIGMLIFTFVVYRIVHTAVLYKEADKWLLIPFSILFGWLTVATITCFTVWLVSIGASGSFLGEVVMTRLLVIATLIIAISVSVRYWDYFYPMAVTWGLIGIYIARKDDTPSPIGTPAFICSIILIVWCLIVIFVKKAPRVEDLPRR